MKHTATALALSLLLGCAAPVPASAATAGGQLPLDTVLARLDDEISACLDDATRNDRALQLVDSALSLDGVEHSDYYLAMLYHKGTYYMRNGQQTEAKRVRLSMLAMMDGAETEQRIGVLHDLGLIYRREGQLDSALNYYDRALNEAVAAGDLEWQAAINLNVGVLYYNLNHLEEAETYLDRALTQVRQVDDPYTLLCVLQVSGAVKVMLHKPQEAEPRLREAYAMAEEAEMPEWKLRCITTMLPLFDLLHMPDTAAHYLSEGNTILPLLPRLGITAVGYLTSRADHYYINGQWREAVADFQTIMATGSGAVRTAAVFEKMAYCYKQLGQWPEAYAFMDSARIQADSAAREQLTNQMADFNVKYRTMEKDLEISRLHTQRLWIAAAAAALMLLAAVTWLVLRYRRQRREAQMRIATLEDERRRIARELHDGLCNDLLALEMQMQFAGGNSQQTTANGQSPAARLHDIRHQARELSHQLMPPQFDHISIAQLLLTYTEALNRATTLNATLTLPDDGLKLPPKLSHEVYRIVQEQTANIVKGATATTIDIALLPTATNAYRLTIADDGKAADDSAGNGLGHRTLRDRVTAIGARSNAYTDGGRNFLEIDFTA